MKMKIILIFVVLLFAVGIAFGENDTDDTAGVEDDGNYIFPSSVSGDLIQFSDGFTGFCLDNSKDKVTTSDGFTLSGFSGDDMENNVKLAIIECYKQGKENEIGKIISKIESKDSSNDIVNEVLSSPDTIGQSSVVKINNTTEATFDFELLKSADENKSDVLAYTVSMKTVKAPKDTSANDTDTDNSTDDKKTTNGNDNDDNNKKANNKNVLGKTKNETKTDKKQDTGKNETPLEKTSNKTTEENSDNNTKNNKSAVPSNTDNKSEDNASEENATAVNKTVVNKTKTVVVNEKNTTIINKTNVKTINNTTEEPQNDTASNIMKTVGNPIVILIIVIIVIAVVYAVVRRKD